MIKAVTKFQYTPGIMCDKYGPVQKILMRNFPDRCMFPDVLKCQDMSVKSGARFPDLKLHRAVACLTHPNGKCNVFPPKTGKSVKVLAFGPPCVMFSRRGNKLGADDPRYKCHEVALQRAEEGEYDIIMLENVLEYMMEEQCRRMHQYDWKIAKNVDPRRFGYPLSRPRQVAVGVRTNSMVWTSASSLDDLLKDFEAEECSPSLTEFYFVLSAQQIQRLHGDWYDLSKPCSASLAPTFANAMREYNSDEQFKQRELWDLSQVPSHGHASTSLADGSMMCLTTNTPYVYNPAVGRLLFPEEALNAMGIPVLDHAASSAGVDPFILTDVAGKAVSYSAKVSLAGNGWLSRKFVKSACMSACMYATLNECVCMHASMYVCI